MKYTTRLFLRILQNGCSLADESFPINKRKNLVINSSDHGILSLPYYPLPKKINLLKIRSKKGVLNINLPWTGQLFLGGELCELCGSGASQQVYQMDIGDYASLNLNDLQILIKIERIADEKKIKHNSTYNGSILRLMFSSYYEKLSMLLALFCSIVLCFSALAFFLKTGYNKPTKFEQLDKSYTIPFISKASLLHTPEALQNNLNRKKMVASTVKYFNNVSRLLVGLPIEESKYIFQSSRTMHKKLYSIYNDKIKNETIRQMNIDIQQMKERSSHVLNVPSVYGMSFRQKILMLISKNRIMHEGFELSLNLRKEITTTFRKDPDYDWGQYDEGGNSLNLIKVTTEEDLKKLSAVSVFHQKTNEEVMYDNALKLSKDAALVQEYIEARSENKVSLTSDESQVIYIPAGVRFASFLQNAMIDDKSDSFIASLEGMGYLKKSNDKPKEPLVGSINSSLLELTIKKHRFELNLCYELALRRNQNLQGKMSWVWRLDSRGSVSDITLEKTSLHDRQMINCVRRKMASWRFPRPRRGSVRVHHMFTFEPQSGI